MNTVSTSTRQGTPHKSTTHEELFFHVENRGTVFFRKEGDKWYRSCALRDVRDQFCRKTGRNVARRKYFQGKRKERVSNERPSYDDAKRVIVAESGRRFIKF